MHDEEALRMADLDKFNQDDVKRWIKEIFTTIQLHGSQVRYLVCYGADLAEAAASFMADVGDIDNKATIDIISAKKLSSKVESLWKDREGELFEAWKFAYWNST